MFVAAYGEARVYCVEMKPTLFLGSLSGCYDCLLACMLVWLVIKSLYAGSLGSFVEQRSDYIHGSK
jgi:hypothetical protein